MRQYRSTSEGSGKKACKMPWMGGRERNIVLMCNAGEGGFQHRLLQITGLRYTQSPWGQKKTGIQQCSGFENDERLKVELKLSQDN